MEARHGSTTVVNAEVGVITNIVSEHSRIIGPSLNDVAKEKAGVIHLGSNIIVGMGRCKKYSSKVVSCLTVLMLPIALM